MQVPPTRRVWSHRLQADDAALVSAVLQLVTLRLQTIKTYLHHHPVSAAISKLNVFCTAYGVNSPKHVRDSLAIRTGEHKLSYLLTYLLTYCSPYVIADILDHPTNNNLQP